MFQRGRFGRSELVAVGRRLRLHRVAKGWSLKRLSEVSGVSVAAIRKIELGESQPRPAHGSGIARSLGSNRSTG